MSLVGKTFRMGERTLKVMPNSWRAADRIRAGASSHVGCLCIADGSEWQIPESTVREKVGMKTYFAHAIWLNNMQKKHVGGNGNKQASVLIRAKTKKRVAELLKTSLHHLNRMGCHLITEARYVAVCKRDETAYYNIGYGPDHEKWFEVKI